MKQIMECIRVPLHLYSFTSASNLFVTLRGLKMALQQSVRHQMLNDIQTTVIFNLDRFVCKTQNDKDDLIKHFSSKCHLCKIRDV